MATVVSLTETKIQELLSGWEGVALTQDDINALMAQLRFLVMAQGSDLEHFNEVVRPQLEADLAAGSIALSDLQANLLPDLQNELADAKSTIDLLETHTIPAIQEELASTAIVVSESPSVYIQAEEPQNPDGEDRYLVVGDVWYDSDDNNTQRIWNGTAWTSFNIDVGELTVQVKNFVSPRHQIY